MLTDARVNAMLDTEFAAGDKISAHTAYSLTGTNEITGGSYARQTITWSAAGSRSKASSGNMDIPIPAGNTVAWLGVWNSAGSTFRGMFPNAGIERSFQIDLTNNRIYCETNLWANDQRVTFTGTTLPTNLTAGTAYWVVGTTAGDPDYFQVSATQGGAAIDITISQPSADARVSVTVLEVYGSDGTHRVTSLSIGM
jgi:hypothetical protein